jgi:hypothetical protein
VKNTGAKFMFEHLNQMGEMLRSEINKGVANAFPCDPRCKRGPVGVFPARGSGSENKTNYGGTI